MASAARQTRRWPAFDDVVARFRRQRCTLELQVQVAKALFNKGVTHGRRDESVAELTTYDDLVARFGASDAPDLQVRVARAMLNKGVTHGQRDESEAELTTYDDLVARFGASDAPDLQVPVAKALSQQRDVTHGQRGESEAELASLRRSRRPVSAPATPRSSRCRLPRRYSTRALGTASAATPRRRWPPTTIWLRGLAPAMPRTSRYRWPGRCSTRALRTAGATSPRRS